MSPKNTDLVQCEVPADACDRERSGGSCERAVPAEMPLAELRQELIRRISEARLREDVFAITGPQEDQARGEWIALGNFYTWLSERKTASGISAGTQNPAMPDSRLTTEINAPPTHPPELSTRAYEPLPEV